MRSPSKSGKVNSTPTAAANKSVFAMTTKSKKKRNTNFNS